MDKFKDLFPEDLYHSYIVEGDPSTTPSELLDFIKISYAGNLDVFFQLYDSFTVEDSSRIKEWHREKGVTDGKRICIIGAKFINHDAERTLLKIIEEPSENTHFFIVVPSARLLLDTILSRSHVVSTLGDASKDSKKLALEFVKSDPQGRIDMVADIIDEHKDDEGSGSLRYDAIALVNELEQVVYKNWQINKNDKNLESILEELAKARDYLSLPGCSVKMVLEHISLVL